MAEKPDTIPLNDISPAALSERLAALHRRTGETPLFNPVGQLGFEISRALEAGHVSLDDIAETSRACERDAFAARAGRLHRFCAPLDAGANIERLEALASRTADDEGAEDFARRWERPAMGFVFTAHPTFLLSSTAYAALAEAASQEPPAEVDLERAAESEHHAPTLEEEHEAAMAAIGRAADAAETVIDAVISITRRRFSRAWRRISPDPIAPGTWVGYDMDGRTDIDWPDCIRFRLDEKRRQLGRYCRSMDDILSLAERGDASEAQRRTLSAITERLGAGRDHAQEMRDALTGDLGDPATLSKAANRLTEERADRLVSLDGILKDLEAVIDDAPDALAARLVRLAAVMRHRRLGVATIHFRMNASQLHNAIRRRIGVEESVGFASRTAVMRIRSALEEVAPVPINFAALAIESTTAVRQYLMMAQIFKHIDSDSAIRLLIAECEQPATVLAALYFARLFGVAERVDISPLFETEAALEHGGRMLDQLLGEDAFCDYARARGRIAIQTGFSDAGRFLGQIPASLAIERLQGRLAASMERHGLADVSALIFNTHGESMGRGGHPAGFDDRLAHAMSPWARRQFADRGIDAELEASFQGGDGFVLFGTQALALATLTRVLEADDRLASAQSEDPFYADVDLSLDFYRAVRRVQADMFTRPAYIRALTAFGLSLLRSTGSRVSKRQGGISADDEAGLRRIRAIPHNAVLQQLGYPVNVLAGIGQAVAPELDRFVDLHNRSPRAQSLLRLAQHCAALASIKTLMAYGELFNGAFWATRPYRGDEPDLEPACLDLAERLVGDDRTEAFRKLATDLRVDGLKLHRLFARIDDEIAGAQENRRTLGVLHALRLAVLQHMFIRAAQIPPFARRNDISRDDMMAMVFSLRIPDALELLHIAYPVEAPALEDFNVEEKTRYPDDGDPEYARINAQFIDPIARSFHLLKGISTAIAHHFGAHG